MEDLDRWQVYVEDPAVTHLQRHRRLQAQSLGARPGDAADVEHARERRSALDGLQQRALHPHAVSGDESGVRRSRFLLRRSLRAAGRADQGPAVEGVRTRAASARSIGSSNDPLRSPRRSVSVSRRDESLSRRCSIAGGRGIAEPHRDAANDERPMSRTTRRSSSGTTSHSGRRRGRLGRLDHAERRLGARVHCRVNTGFGLSQRMQSFVMDAQINPFNVLAPGQAAARDVEPEHGAARRQAVPVVRGAGRRCARSESAAVLLERGRVRDERAASRRSGERQQLSNARIRSAITRRSRAVSSCATTRRRGYAPSSSAWAIASKAGSARRARSTRSSSIARNGSLWGGSSDFGEDYGIAW